MVAKLLVAALLSAPLPGPYVDPGGAFACAVPQGWTAQRTDLGDGLALTEFADHNDEKSANVTVFVQNAGGDIPSSQYAAVNDAFLGFIVESLQGEGTVTNQKRSEVTFDGRKCARMDLGFTDGEGVQLTGRITVAIGKRNAVAVITSWRNGDDKGKALAAGLESTVKIESKTPGSGGSGLFSKDSLAAATGQMKSNFARKPMGTVISQGEPPLTYGSIANFVTVIEILFDIQLTESEFAATQERFIEYYKLADGEGKRILAEQGASLLKTLTSGTAEEREQSRQEGKAVFENAFKNGAEMGIGYAQVMWDAISRRSNAIAQAKGQPAKDGWDREISEGDIDATMEMLVFMWVGAGRPTEEVTAENVMAIRGMILQNLATMDPQLQMLIANAPKIYAGLRQKWAAGSLETRFAMAQQFDAALTEWGIGSTGFEQSGGGGGSGGGSSMNAEIAMNTAWNSAKTWTTTSGG